VDALVRCLAAAGGTVHCGQPVDRVEVAGGRAVAVHAGGERFAAARAVVSALDARRLFLGLLDERDAPRRLADEVRRIHVGRGNVSELKVDAVLAGRPALPGPAGFERSFLLSAKTIGDVERSFARIRLGELPERPPLMIAFRSALEPGWAPDGRAIVWLSSFVPWRLASGSWEEQATQRAADHVWRVAERALGVRLDRSSAGSPGLGSRSRPGAGLRERLTLLLDAARAMRALR
jgi:beta-carotene ketolase (CrtO type)